jgi:hypothetical protein
MHEREGDAMAGSRNAIESKTTAETGLFLHYLIVVELTMTGAFLSSLMLMLHPAEIRKG